MKKGKFVCGYFFIVLTLLIGCVGPERRDEGGLPDESDAARDLGGRPDESEIVVRGVFYSPQQDCQSGFGLCEAKLLPKRERNVPLDTLREQGVRTRDALYRIDTRNHEFMVIEFLQQVPNFEKNFVVDSIPPNDYQNIFGYDMVRILPGVYEADSQFGTFGAVRVRIQVGQPRRGGD